jgi:diguanylate cyclase (GGDEF)-like protein
MSGENQNEDIVKIGTEQGRLETLRSDDKSPKDLKSALQTYRQVYFNEVNTGKAELTTALGNTDLYQSKESRDYLKINIAFGLANAVGELATEGQRIKTAGEEQKEYPTLKTLKEGVKSKLSQEKTALTEYGELEGVRKKLSEFYDNNAKLSDSATLANVSTTFSQKQGIVKSIEAIEKTFKDKSYSVAGDLQTKLKERAQKYKDSIEDDLEDCSKVIGAKDEYREVGTVLSMIENGIKKEKKPLSATAYEQYSKELKTSLGEMTRIYDQYNVDYIAGATLGIFKEIGANFYPKILSPVEKQLTSLITVLEKEKPKDVETKLDPELNAQLEYDDAQQKTAGFAKELAELEKIEEENKTNDAARLDRKNYEDYLQKVKGLKKKYEEFKGSHALFKYPAVTDSTLPGYNGYQLQAKFINVTEKPFLSRLDSLDTRTSFSRWSEIDKFEKKVINENIQTIIVELKAQWQTNVTDQAAFLEPAPTTDEESQAFKDFLQGENKLLTFVVSAEAQLNVFLSRKGMIEDGNLKELESLIKQARENFTKISNNRQHREMQKAAKEGETQSHTYTRNTGRKIQKEVYEAIDDKHGTTTTVEVDETEEVTDEYKFADCVEFINPSDPKYSEINDGKGFRFIKDVPEEVKTKMEIEAGLIISSKKESVQAEMSKQKMEILKTGDLIEVGKETLGEKGKAYFAGVEAMQKGDTATAIKSFQEYLTLSASFDENEKEMHEMYIQDAQVQIEALNLSGTFYEAMALMKDKKLDEAVPKLREFINTIQAKPEAEQKKCAEQLASAIEIVKQINSAKLSMLIDLKKDMEFVEVRRIVTNGTPSKSLDKDATGVFRDLMLPFVPYDTLTEAEKEKVDQGRGGLQGEEIQLLNRKIGDLKKRIDNGEPVDFEEEFGKIKTDLQTFNDKHYSIGGKFKNDDGQERPDWPSERIFDNFQKINSFDAKKREKGFTEIAQFLIDEQSSLGDMKLSMRYSQKYLDKAMQSRYQQFTEDDGGALQKEIRSKMLRDSSIAADIQSGAVEMYKRWASETNRKLPKSEHYSLDNPDPASLKMFQKQLFESRLKYQYEREVRKKLTDQGEDTDGSALKLYNWSLPHDYQDARWYKPWSWSDYNQDDWVDFKEKTKEFVAETVITLPIGMGAGSIGKAVGSAGIRLLAAEGISEAAILTIERGGLMALRADAALWKGVSVGMRARLLTGYGMGVVAEGGSLLVMNSIYEGFSSGRTPEFFHMLEEGNWAKAAITLTESIGKAGAFRVIGGATQKMFGNAMNSATTGTKILGILGSESFSGFTGTGIEALSLLAKGQGDQITFDFWAKSLAQNAIQSYGTHIAHNTAPKLIDTQAGTQKKFNTAETEIAVQKLAEMGIKSPLDLVNIHINSEGQIILKPTPDSATTDGTYRQPPQTSKLDLTKINIEALPPQIREPLKAKIKEVKAEIAPPAKVNTPETPTTDSKAEPSNEKGIGKEKFKVDDINKASGDKPLKPFQADSPDTAKLIKTGEDLSKSIEASKNSESQRQNPDSTPEHQQSWGRAYLDKLTGLYNRNGFRIAESWFTNSKSVALASFDGDYFGAFNKLKGTVLGDQVIKQMAKNFHELQQQFRDQGIEAMVIREGGEEFTVIARDINSTQMRLIMDNFRQKLQVDTQNMIKSLDSNLQIELIQYLQATGKLPQNFPPEHFLTGDRFKLGPIGGSTVGVADVNLSVNKPKDPGQVLDALKRHADHALEDGKNSRDGGRNRTYRATSLNLKQYEDYIADSKLDSTRTSPDQPSQTENLQNIYEQGVERRSERFDDLGKTRGWKDVQPIVESADIQTQAKLQRLLASGKLTAKDIAGMTDKTGASLAPHTEALLKFQTERLQVMEIMDTLTGVQNETGLAALLKLRKEQGIPVESYNLDIKLKPINENLGHIGGDAYLMTSAKILSDIVQNLPRGGSDPSSQKFSSKRISIFRKNPLDGGGFRLIAPDGTLTQQHLDYIMQQYQERMQTEFFDKIGKDSNGRAVTDDGGLLPKWIKDNSTQPEIDRAQLGRINIIRESQAKLDSIVDSQTQTNYRARPEDFQYTQIPSTDQLPTQPQPAKNGSDNQPTRPETIDDGQTQPNIPKIAPTELDIAPLMNKSYADSLKQIESGQIDPTPAIITHLVENIGSGDILALLNNSKLKFSPQQQSRLIDRVISDHTLFPSTNPKKEPFKVPDQVATHLKEAILKGKIDLTDSDVAQRLASYETGQLVLIDLIFNQQLSDHPAAYRALTDQLLTTKPKLETLGILLDGQVFPESIKNEVSQKFEQKEKAFADAKHAEYQLSKFSQEFKAELKNLLETDFRNNLDPSAQLLTRLSERDPQGFNILKDNISNLPDTYVQAIIEGRKTEFIDTKGQKITAYTGNQVGHAGGVGTAFHSAYVIGESTKLNYAVIKKPHENRKEVFRSETAGAELAGNFGSPYINKILHAGKDFAIFETGQNVRSLYEEIQASTPRQSLILLRQVMEAMQAYRQNGYFHGDLKEVNAIVIDGPNGREVRVIDNDPVDPKSQRGQQFAWFRTPGYFEGNANQLGEILADGNKYSGVWDSYALGVMLSTFSNGSMGLLLSTHQPQLGSAANRLLLLGSQLKNKEFATRPDALTEAMSQLDSIIATLPPDSNSSRQSPPPLPVIDNKTTPAQTPTLPGQPLPEQLNL